MREHDQELEPESVPSPPLSSGGIQPPQEGEKNAINEEHHGLILVPNIVDL